MDSIKALKSLNLNGANTAGISFSIATDQKDDSTWKLVVLSKTDADEEFECHDLGYKYIFLLYTGNKAEVFEAVLGDLTNYVIGLVRKNQEGIIVKKSKRTIELCNKILKGRYDEALAAGAVGVEA